MTATGITFGQNSIGRKNRGYVEVMIQDKFPNDPCLLKAIMYLTRFTKPKSLFGWIIVKY